ncbi:hypothetical protein GCM10022206_16650 [Streptomyces chiangmaiensis]
MGMENSWCLWGDVCGAVLQWLRLYNRRYGTTVKRIARENAAGIPKTIKEACCLPCLQLISLRILWPTRHDLGSVFDRDLGG